MPKQQINIKLSPDLVEALRSKAVGLGITLTDLIQGYCEQGLGLPSSSNHFDFDELYKRIVLELDKRIPSQVDERISSQVTGLHKRLENLEQGLDEALGELSA
jgi:hypothetical protein